MNEIGGKIYYLKMNPFYTVLGQMWLKIVINNNQSNVKASTDKLSLLMLAFKGYFCIGELMTNFRVYKKQ